MRYRSYVEKITKALTEYKTQVDALEVGYMREKRELTENDKKFIDTLVDSKYPSLAKDRVKALAEADADIESLLLLDERYSKYLEE